MMRLNDIEEEVVFLSAVVDVIDSVVNHEVVTLRGVDPESTVTFEDSTHQRFFSIVLVDFLSCTDKKAPVTQRSYLGALRAISDCPHFSIDDSDASLRTATKAFVAWLKVTPSIEIWLPSLNMETTLQLSRMDFLKMSGDISKHNTLRAVGVAEKLRRALAGSGIDVPVEQASLALGDFYERYHVDLFAYHASTIAEFLNNIRRGIHDYLQPELRRSRVVDEGDPARYRYTYPEGVVNIVAQRCYWDLMNKVREPPYLRRFQVPECLKLRY